MVTYKPQGSEKITNMDDKLRRIQELGKTKKTTLNESKHNTKFSTVLHESVAADGNQYALVQEGSKVYIKTLINEHYEYVTGDEKDYSYKDFATAFKHLNLLFKDINVQTNHNKSINLFESGLNEKKNLISEKFVLKQPQSEPIQTPPQTPESPMPDDGSQPPQMPQQQDQSQELSQAFDDAENGVEDQDPAKAIQKLVGKLTQKMRTTDDQIMTSEFMKSILNSVISAIKLDKMEDNDLLSVIKKLKGNENAEAAAPEADPSGADPNFTDDQGVDYNVNNPANTEKNDLNEDDVHPTSDDNTLKGIVEQIVKNLGVDVNEANKEDVLEAVNLFIQSYDNDQQPSNFMKELKEFVEVNADMNTPSYKLSYSALSPLGKDIFEQLEVYDPTMSELNPTNESNILTNIITEAIK